MANKLSTYEIGILPVKKHGVSHGPQLLSTYSTQPKGKEANNSPVKKSIRKRAFPGKRKKREIRPRDSLVPLIQTDFGCLFPLTVDVFTAARDAGHTSPCG